MNMTMLKTFPDLNITGTKQSFKMPVKLATAVKEQQAAESVCSNDAIGAEVLEAVRLDVEAGKNAVRLGEYYIEFSGWNLEQQNAHLTMLAELQKIAPILSADFTPQQRHISTLYAAWPELLAPPTGKSVSDSRAAKRYTYAIRQAKDYRAELEQNALIAEASKLVAGGDATEADVTKLLETGKIKDAAQLADVIANVGIFPTITADATPAKVKYVGSLKAFLIDAYAFLESEKDRESQKTLTRLAGLVGGAGVDASKLTEWIKEGHGKAKTMAEQTDGEGGTIAAD